MKEKAIFIIKPDAISCRQEIAIKKFLLNNAIKIENEKKIKFNDFEAKVLLRKYKNEEWYSELMDLMKSSFSICYTVSCEHSNINSILSQIVGNFDPRTADGGTLRSIFLNNACIFEQTPIYNSVLFSEDEDENERFLKLLYKDD